MDEGILKSLATYVGTAGTAARGVDVGGVLVVTAGMTGTTVTGAGVTGVTTVVVTGVTDVATTVAVTGAAEFVVVADVRGGVVTALALTVVAAG